MKTYQFIYIMAMLCAIASNTEDNHTMKVAFGMIKWLRKRKLHKLKTKLEGLIGMYDVYAKFAILNTE